MGAWGTGIFENDDALDWLCEWQDADDGVGDEDEPGKFAYVIGALAVAVDTKGYMEVDTGGCALAAAESVAAANGKIGPEMKKPEGALAELLAWSKGRQADDLRTTQARRLAMDAVDRVLAENSELAELWSESEDSESWRGRVADLRARLG